MRNVTIIGKGNMGSAIAALLAKGGAAVTHIDTSSDGAVATGEIVILAVPYEAVPQVIATYGAQLDGKIVVDITNPVNLDSFTRIVPDAGSAAQEFASALPSASVVKAFNTNFAGTLASASIGTDTPTVLIAGDDTHAKSSLADAISSGGIVPIDAGPLSHARELEALAFLQISLAVGETISWTGGFNLVR